MKLIVVLMLSIFLFQENNPPKVKITAPVAAAAGSPLKYSISVSDKEDGDTKFDEINPNEILLQVEGGQNGKRKDVNEIHAMMASNCMNCHAFKSRLIGPSYMDISNRYSPADVSVLVKHIKDGSKGVWGETVMPTHPELSDPEINNMVKWIMNYKKSETIDFYLGKEGTIQLQKGKFTLIASYLDHHNTLGEASLTVQVK